MKFIQVMMQYPAGATSQLKKKENFYWYTTSVMKKIGIDSEIWVIRKKGLKETEIVTGIKVRRFKNIFSLLYNLRRGKDIAIIHAHLRPFLPSLLSCLANKPTILTPHTYVLGSNKLIEKFSLFFMKKFTKIIAITPYEKELYNKKGLNNVVLLPHAINYEFFSEKPPKKRAEVRKNLRIKMDDFVIITMANFRKFKNIDVMIKAFKILNKKNSKFLIIGKDLLSSDIYQEQKRQKGPTSIKGLIKEMKVEDSVLYLGEMDHKQAKDILYASDVFVNSSFPETMGIAIYEAATTGLPLCLSRIGSFTSVFKNLALYHPPYNADKLAENFLTYYKNKTLRKKKGARLKEYMKEWSYRKTIKKFESLYSSLIKK